MYSLEERRQKIESYGRAYDVLIEALRHFSPEMWQYRPAPERWTIHEIIIHITDSEANSYIRVRRFIAQPGTQISAYDEARWAAELSYHDRSTEEALELFTWLRASSYHLIQSLPTEVWSNTLDHPESGLVTLDDCAPAAVPVALQPPPQMQAVCADWQRR